MAVDFNLFLEMNVEGTIIWNDVARWKSLCIMNSLHQIWSRYADLSRQRYDSNMLESIVEREHPTVRGKVIAFLQQPKQ